MMLLQRFFSGSLGRTSLGRVALAVPLVASVVLLVVGMVVLLRPKKTVEYRLNMLSDLVPSRQRLAERIAEEAKNHGLEVHLSAKAYGALEELALVNAVNDIDVAMVPGGVGKEQFPRVRQVTALGVEPLHVVVRPELYDEVSRHGLRALSGKRVNIGPPTTATNLVARDVLRFVGLAAAAADHGYRIEGLTPQELTDRAVRLRGASAGDRARLLADLPDAALVLAPMPSGVVRALVGDAGFRLVGIPFTAAYTLDQLDAEGSDSTHDTGAGIGPIRLDRTSMTTIEIPPFTYGTDPPVPETPCRTLGIRLLLLSYAPTSREAIAKLLEVIFDSPVQSLIHPARLEEQVPQFEFHAGTDLYLRSKRPLFTPELVAQLSKLLGGLGAFASGLVAFYGFLKLRQLRRFEAYYQEIRHIELIARGLEDDPQAPPPDRPAERLAFLEGRLNDLKCEALKDFADGGMKGEGLMSGIAALVNDTRDSLARMTDGTARSEAP
jgi:hypothetical protein